MDRIRVVEGDITRLKVDAIVNAANSALVAGGGVDHAIHAAAGPRLQKASDAIGGCPTGQARVTPGFELSAEYVIHAVGPVWAGGGHREEELLASCYRNSLALAVEEGARTIAFPAISCGAYGYPLDQAARIAVAEVAAYLGDSPDLDEVLLVCWSRDVLAAYRQAYDELGARPSATSQPA